MVWEGDLVLYRDFGGDYMTVHLWKFKELWMWLHLTYISVFLLTGKKLSNSTGTSLAPAGPSSWFWWCWGTAGSGSGWARPWRKPSSWKPPSRRARPPRTQPAWESESPAGGSPRLQCEWGVGFQSTAAGTFDQLQSPRWSQQVHGGFDITMKKSYLQVTQSLTPTL